MSTTFRYQTRVTTGHKKPTPSSVPHQRLRVFLLTAPFVILATLFGVGTGFTLAQHTGGTNVGETRILKIPQSEYTPYAETMSGTYYSLIVLDDQTILNTAERKGFLPSFLFQETIPEPAEMNLSPAPNGEWYVEMPEHWFSTGYAYTTAARIAKNTTVGAADFDGNETVTTGERVNIFPEGRSWEMHIGKQPSASKITLEEYLSVRETVNVPRPKVIKNLRGRSADLIYFLYYLDSLQEGNLSAGKHISATGTLTSSGEIKPVGMVHLKMESFVETMNEQGTRGTFFYPAGNKSRLEKYIQNQISQDPLYAQKITSVNMVPVTDVAQITLWLCEHGGQGEVCN